MVMSGHLYHRGLSPDGREPATLSTSAINGLLRTELGYQGVVITDDLEMGAIRNNFRFRDTIIKAVGAGNDILLISNSAKPDRAMPSKVIAMIRQAVTSGELKMGDIESAFERISRLKQKLAILEQKTAQHN
jgi:beta-N-acetylhexosaminidase